MARNFKPKLPFNVPMKLLKPISVKEYGVSKKGYSSPEDSELIFGSFRKFNGTETFKDDVYTIVDTAVIDTWFRPDIKADCKIYLPEIDKTYEIISDPEDIDMRHQYLQFKVQKSGGRP